MTWQDRARQIQLAEEECWRKTDEIHDRLSKDIEKLRQGASGWIGDIRAARDAKIVALKIESDGSL
jgi:hypothetical protein